MQASKHSLFSRDRSSSVERELSRTPYAFTARPVRDSDDPVIKAKQKILDPFEDDISVRLAKERLFGGYTRNPSRPASPSIFPSNIDFEKRLKSNKYNNNIFGPNVDVEFDKQSDASSIKNEDLILNSVPFVVKSNEKDSSSDRSDSLEDRGVIKIENAVKNDVNFNEIHGDTVETFVKRKDVFGSEKSDSVDTTESLKSEQGIVQQTEVNSDSDSNGIGKNVVINTSLRPDEDFLVLEKSEALKEPSNWSRPQENGQNRIFSNDNADTFDNSTSEESLESKLSEEEKLKDRKEIVKLGAELVSDSIKESQEESFSDQGRSSLRNQERRSFDQVNSSQNEFDQIGRNSRVGIVKAGLEHDGRSSRAGLELGKTKRERLDNEGRNTVIDLDRAGRNSRIGIEQGRASRVGLEDEARKSDLDHKNRIFKDPQGRSSRLDERISRVGLDDEKVGKTTLEHPIGILKDREGRNSRVEISLDGRASRIGLENDGRTSRIDRNTNAAILQRRTSKIELERKNSQSKIDQELPISKQDRPSITGLEQRRISKVGGSENQGTISRAGIDLDGRISRVEPEIEGRASRAAVVVDGRISRAGIEPSRKLSKANVEQSDVNFNQSGRVSRAGIEQPGRSSRAALEQSGRASRAALEQSGRLSRAGLEQAPVVEDPFTVLNPILQRDETESITSTVSSFKVPPTARSHRNTAFAILGEAAPSTSTVDTPEPEETKLITAPDGSIILAAPPPSRPIIVTGRVSPFRGKGFRQESSSRHTSRTVSRPDSPSEPFFEGRPRASSLGRAEPRVKLDNFQTPNVERNFIKENIEEVKELSEFNKERNQELAQQKKVDEEMEILKELGIIDSNNVLKGKGLKSISPSAALLHFESIPPLMKKFHDDDDDFVRKPVVGKGKNITSKSQPQSKVGSPTHRSKIPRRQSSASPERQRVIVNQPQTQSRMSNKLNPGGRFISNSTSSINENRVFSVITDDDNNPVDFEENMGVKSNSSHSIGGAGVLKSKNSRLNGPPPTSRSINSKRLSPIVSTPDKSPGMGRSPITGKNSVAGRIGGIPGRANAGSKVGTPGKPGVNGTNKRDSRSKTPNTGVTSPSRIPKRPSKSLATSPNPSRGPSRTPSRGPVGRDVSPLKKSASVTKLVKGSKSSVSSSATSKGTKKDTDDESKDGDKKRLFQRANSRTSITSKMSVAPNKPPLNRTNSKSSLMSRASSNVNEKPGLRRKSSLKNLQEKSFEEEKGEKGEKGTKGANTKNKGKKGAAKKDAETAVIDPPTQQDNETQYDKLSLFSMDKLIPLTKNNVVSMTTAAITAQPLEIAARVTSQLPTTFEKAREKRELERNSSSDSMAAKMMETSEDDKTDEKTKLQKTASKTSLGSVQEENGKAPLSRGDSLYNNMRLKPILGSNLDPQVEKVKAKIDNILKSATSSVDDLREKVQSEKSAVDKSITSLEKVAEKAEEGADAAKNTIEAKIEEVKNEVIKAGEEIKKEMTEKLSDEIVKSVDKETDKVVQNLDTLKNSGVFGEKVLTPIETVETPNKTSETAKESVIKSDIANNNNKDSPNGNKAELIKVKESVIKKEVLSPVVTVKENNIEVGAESVTEAVVLGEPDVEVQSANTANSSAAGANAAARATIAARLAAKAASKAQARLAANGSTVNNGSTVTNGTNGTTVSNGTSVANGASVSNGASVAGKSTDGHYGAANGSSKKSDSNANGSSNGAGTSNGSKLPPTESKISDPRGTASVAEPNMAGSPEPVMSQHDTQPSGLCGRLNCCRKQNHQSQVQLIDETMAGKRRSTLGSTKTGSMGHQEQKPSLMQRMCCCCGPSTPAGDGDNPGCMSCCTRKNKIRDSSAQARMGMAGKTNAKQSRGIKDMLCCCCSSQSKMDPKDRRDSILSEPPKTSCWRRLLCCCGPLACCGGSEAASRRTSLFSKKRSLSQAVPLEDKRSKLDNSLIEHTSMLRGAIPALPLPLAWVCFVCNILIPGLGTVCSGLFCLCFGRPRFGIYDGWRQRIGAFLIDIVVGVGQLFTVVFCLVGWGWSIWWATIILRVAKKYKKLKNAAADPERAQPPTNNHRTNNA